MFVGFLVVWEVIVRAFQIKQFILPSPVAIGIAWQAMTCPDRSPAARHTLEEIILGLIVGSWRD